MVKTEEKKIGDLVFKTTQFPAMRSLELLTRLIRVIGPALGALMDMAPDAELGPEAIGALGPALSSLDPKDATALVAEILQCTSVYMPDAAGGRSLEFAKRENIDAVFTGKLRMMLAVLGFVVQVNFADFTEGSAPAAPLPKTTAQS